MKHERSVQGSTGISDTLTSATRDTGEASVTDVCGMFVREAGLLGLRNVVRWRDGGRRVNAGAFCISCATSAASNRQCFSQARHFLNTPQDIQDIKPK